MSNVIRGSNGMKYRIVKNGSDFVVVELHAKRDKDVFYGTKSECYEWLERNGHDAWN